MSSLNSLLRADDVGAIEPITRPGPLRRVLLLVGGHTGRVGGTLLKLLAL